ncbi:hypothetical protein [Burkholderia gladioli]|uniref:hypothetical protein n=1 Tax=Burkholderia gladioli TaxID=28095 RepID=UPI00163E3D22|nr:hypothetical protein [Burkholderia gladioli]
MKAIETQYKGYRFRSRLEARWAVFFDALGITWEYEPEGFDLGFGERYLPDFFLRISDDVAAARGWQGLGYGYWVEVKAIEPSEHEMRKLQAVCRGTGHRGCLVHGLPGINPWRSADFPDRDDQPLITARELHAAAFVSMCSSKPAGRTAVGAAARAARGARFEFGEHGATA